LKTYQVIFDPGAHAEALEAADYIAQFAPERAVRWFTGLQAAVNSLEVMPARCGRARESVTLDADLRQKVYHSHRIIFRIEEEARIVRILHVRHAARRTIGEDQGAKE